MLGRGRDRASVSRPRRMDGWSQVERHAAITRSSRILVGVCNKAPAGRRRWAGRSTRSSSKPASTRRSSCARPSFRAIPKRPWSQQLGKLITGGGRRVVVQDSDWRTMMALAGFRKRTGADPELRRLAQADPPLDQPQVAAHDPGPGSIGTSRNRRRPRRRRRTADAECSASPSSPTSTATRSRSVRSDRRRHDD